MQGLFNIARSINQIYHIHRIKDRNIKSISIDTEKVFDKFHYPMINKTKSKLKLSKL